MSIAPPSLLPCSASSKVVSFGWETNFQGRSEQFLNPIYSSLIGYMVFNSLRSGNGECVGTGWWGWCYLLWLCTNHDRRCLLLTLTRYAGVPSLWNTDMDTLSLTKLLLIIKRQPWCRNFG